MSVTKLLVSLMCMREWAISSYTVNNDTNVIRCMIMHEGKTDASLHNYTQCYKSTSIYMNIIVFPYAGVIIELGAQWLC